MQAMMWAGSIWVRLCLQGPSKHRNEALLFLNGGEFLQHLTRY